MDELRFPGGATCGLFVASRGWGGARVGMGVLSLLLKDPGALPYLLQVKVRHPAAPAGPRRADAQRGGRAAAPAQRWDTAAKKLPQDKSLAFCYGAVHAGGAAARGAVAPAQACWRRLTRGRRPLRRADVLNRVSRSFAIVIQQLGPELRDAVRAASAHVPAASLLRSAP
jgi:hypothetical protein